MQWELLLVKYIQNTSWKVNTYGIYARVVNVSEMSLVRSLVIATFWMESVIWELSNLNQCLSNSVFCATRMSQVQGFGRPKHWTRKRIVYQFCSKIYDYMNKWALQIFREWQDQKALKICTIQPGGLFKGEDLWWMFKSCLNLVPRAFPL